jgi:hypothetical protein
MDNIIKNKLLIFFQKGNYFLIEALHKYKFQQQTSFKVQIHWLKISLNSA